MRQVSNTIERIMAANQASQQALENKIESLQLLLSKNRLEDDFEIMDTIGQGGFSIVKQGKNKSTGQLVALKMIYKQKAFTGMDLLQEAKLQNVLGSHQNVIGYYGLYDYQEFFVMVLELVSGGELLKILLNHFEHDTVSYSESEIAVVLWQVVAGVAHAHERRIIHRDLKPDNILAARYVKLGEPNGLKQGAIKLCDFGMAITLEEGEKLKATCGTAEYMAPERLKGLPYDTQSDVWSLGVLLYILVAGTFPYWGNNSTEILEKQLSPKYPIMSDNMKKISKDCINLLKSMLQIDPAKRPTCKELLKHPWLCGKTAYTFEMAGVVAQLRRFNARRKFRICINGIRAQNRMGTILKAIRSEKYIMKLTMKEDFTMDKLKILYQIYRTESQDEDVIDPKTFAKGFVYGLKIRNEHLMASIYNDWRLPDGTINYVKFCLALATKLCFTENNESFAHGYEGLDNSDSNSAMLVDNLNMLSKPSLLTAKAIHRFLEFAFYVFDREQDEKISRAEFVAMTSAIGVSQNPLDLAEDFSTADDKNVGYLDKEDFRRYFLNNQVFIRYFRNTRRMLVFRKEVFESEVQKIKENYSGNLLIKRKGIASLMSSYKERYADLDAKTKVMHIYANNMSYKKEEKPIISIDFTKGKLITSILGIHQKVYKFLDPTIDKEGRASLVWEYSDQHTDDAWFNAFKSVGITAESESNIL